MKYFIAVLCLAYIATASADKCTDVYNSCVNATGSDPMSRFKCGMKYLRCRFNDMRSDEEIADELFDGEDKPECKVGFVDCMKAARKAEDKMAARKMCIKNKYVCAKENAKEKYACLKKCKDVDGMKEKMRCAAKCFKKEEEEKAADELFDEGDKCTDVYDSCVNATGSDPMSRFKCGMKYLRCRFNDMRSDEEIADELFDGEDKPECKVGFVDCMKAAQKAEDKMAARKMCIKNKYVCAKENAKDKYACLKKCKDVNGMKEKMICAAKCFKKEEEALDFADELFDGEDKPECKVGFVDCMKAARNAEDKMAASKVCFEKKAACIKEKLQPKIDCVNKCREELKSCRVDGTSRMQCGYKFYKCVKPCKDA